MSSHSIYIASGLANYARVIDMQRWFAHRGVDVTFDWAGRWKTALLDLNQGGRGTPALAKAMAQAVAAADLFLLVNPGKRGAHVEFGIAVGRNKPVVILSENPDDDISFYYLPQVVGLCRDEDEALAVVLATLRPAQPGWWEATL